MFLCHFSGGRQPKDVAPDIRIHNLHRQPEKSDTPQTLVHSEKLCLAAKFWWSKLLAAAHDYSISLFPRQEIYKSLPRPFVCRSNNLSRFEILAVQNSLPVHTYHI